MTDKPWYEFDPKTEPLDDCRDRRLMECPLLTASQLEQLRQLRKTVWDGHVISKSARTDLVHMGLVTRWNGWQVITKEGMAVLDTLNEMNDEDWGTPRERKVRR